MVVTNSEIKMVHKGNDGKDEESLQMNSKNFLKYDLMFINLSSVFEAII